MLVEIVRRPAAVTVVCPSPAAIVTRPDVTFTLSTILATRSAAVTDTADPVTVTTSVGVTAAVAANPAVATLILQAGPRLRSWATTTARVWADDIDREWIT